MAATPSSIHDFVSDSDDIQKHTFLKVVFWPKLWGEFSTPSGHRWRWRTIPFTQRSARRIPDTLHGVYAFVIHPRIVRHPGYRFIVYVGKADRMSIRERFLSYFNNKKNLTRPQITRFMVKYDGFVDFTFCEVSKKHINDAENALLSSIVPVLNKRFPVRLSAIMRAF